MSADLDGIPVVDSAAFAEIQLLGDDLVLELVQLFQDMAPQFLATMTTARDRNDVQAIQRAAHSLKSSSAGLGALRVSKIARALEHFELHGNVPNRLNDLIHSLETEIKAALVDLGVRVSKT